MVMNFFISKGRISTKTKKKSSKTIKKYRKQKGDASKKLLKLEEEFREEFPYLSHKQIQFKLMGVLRVREKDHNFSGGRFFILTLFVSIFAIVITNSINDSSFNSDLQNYYDTITSSHEPLYKKAYFLILITIFYSIPVALIILPFVIFIKIFDRRYRKSVLTNNIMIELLKEKISNSERQI